MSASPHTWMTLGLLGLALASSFLLSGMEAGVFALNRLRIRQWARKGNPAAVVLNRYLEQSEDFLWTIQVGNVVGTFVVTGITLKLLHDGLHAHPGWFVCAFVVFVFGFYSLGDLLPKMLFRASPNRFCVALVRPFRLLHFLLSPLVSITTQFSQGLLRWTGGRTFTGRLFGDRAELRFVMQESAGDLTSEERTMINRVLDLQHLTVGQVARPLKEVVAVEAKTPVREVLDLCREPDLTRLPVWREGAGGRRIAGVVNLNTMLYLENLDPARTAGDYVKPALFLDGDLRLEHALRRMQRTGDRLAVVLDRNQREVGIVTLQDILRAVFGEVNL